MEFNATFLVSAVSFIVFVFIMNAIFYAPLQRVVDERKNVVDDNYNEAKYNSEKASALIKDRADRLLKANVEAKSHMVEKTDEAKSQKDDITKEAQQKAFSELELAKDELTTSTNQAKNALKESVVGLAQTISDKMLGENVQIKDVDNEVIDRIMQES